MNKLIVTISLCIIVGACGGCSNPFARGLDVCEDDACYLGVTKEYVKEGKGEDARQFCDAMEDESNKEQCADLLSED